MDKIFRSKIYDHPSAMPGGMWDKIKAGLKEDKKRRGFVWFWFGLLGIAFMVGTGFLIASVTSNGNTLLHSVEADVELLSAPSLQADFVEPNEELVAAPNEFLSSTSLSLPIKSVLTSLHIDIEKMIPENPHGTDKLTLPANPESITSYLAQKTRTSKDLEKNIPNDNSHEVELDKQLQLMQSVPAAITPPLLESHRLFSDPIICPSFFSRNSPNIFVEAYYQPFMALSMLSSNSPEIGDSYLKLRRDTESPLYSWSAGLNIGWISDYNVGIKAGAEYEVINERFTFLEPNAIRNQTVITIDTMFNGDGSFNVATDTSIVQIAGEEIQEIHNYHRTLSIPVQALYQINMDNFALELSGGPIFHMNYQNRGKIVDPASNAQWFTNGESGTYDVYKKKLSVSFTFSASAMYSLNESIQLFVRPRVRFSPRSITQTNSPFNQKYLNAGLALGARYYFSGNPNY